MRSLIYLIRVETKNKLKELFRNPGKLFLYFAIIVAIFWSFLSTLSSTLVFGGIYPREWFIGIYFVFVAMFFVVAVQRGLSSGNTMFTMNDVNLLFISPLNPKIILIYGLLRLSVATFWASFYILLQGAVARSFNINFQGLLILFFMFLISKILFSVLSLTIYSITNGKPRRKFIVRVLSFLCFAPLVIYYLVQLFTLNDALAAVSATVFSPFFNLIPFIGWTAAASLAFIEGAFLTGALWLVILLLAGAGMIIYIMLHQSDYYEDVLVATETEFEKNRAIEEGNMQTATVSDTNIKVTKTGIGGIGASTFFFKHMRETFRESRLGFFSLSTMIIFVIVLGVSIWFRKSMSIITILSVLMTIQIFMIGTGRGIKELYSHYIYMVPEPSLRKIIWSNVELMLKTFVQSILFLAIPGIILSGNILVIIGVVITYTLFSFLLIGENYLSMKITDSNISQGLLVAIYFLAVIVALIPGLVPAFIIGAQIGGPSGIILGLAILSAWELIAALVCFTLSKNVINNTDMPL